MEMFELSKELYRINGNIYRVVQKSDTPVLISR